MYETEQTRQVTEFNENAAKIQRLNNYWLEIARLRHNGNLIKVIWVLDTVEAELKWDAESLDNKLHTTFVRDLKRLNKFMTLATNEMLYYLTLRKEELLRKIQQEIGMGTTYKDPEEDDWD